MRTLKKLCQIRPQMVTSLTVAATLILLAGCSKPVEKLEDIRPVRVLHLGAANVDVTSDFSGVVMPRIESRLGFRVGGKIVQRKVDVGATVKRGQVLMQLDPQDLQLAQTQANAGLRAAQSNRDLAQAELKRYQDLRAKNFVSQTVLDAKSTAYQSAQASLEQAAAAYKGQSNQAGYAVLTADADGVVTGVDAEVGQVVAAGTSVVRVAQLGDKEVVFGIPEHKIAALRQTSDVQIRTWANPGQAIEGKIREISPVADPATRTYTTKVSIPNAPASIQLGMTATVSFASKTPNAMLKVPLTALLQEKSQTSVWVVDHGVVKLSPVKVAGTAGNDILLMDGVTPGQTIVTAGVNQLKPGQKVSILGEDASQVDAGVASASKIKAGANPAASVTAGAAQ
ncbi:efflux RND transporter periplasmic adaptor subunit [Undibacterium arcticum]|uniref:Efflux RND transporter periplasmic adaptor subunit n=2 Tax=Undibacterium arcticum TaxID=1762892 RepID=A0ABV7FAI5_9BURK